MAVYVDDMRAPHRGMLMCHMIGDTTEELNAMADRIGVARRWLQKAGTYQEHYDICMTKKAQAIRYGAQEITQRALGRKLRERRKERETHG